MLMGHGSIATFPKQWIPPPSSAAPISVWPNALSSACPKAVACEHQPIICSLLRRHEAWQAEEEGTGTAAFRYCLKDSPSGSPTTSKDEHVL